MSNFFKNLIYRDSGDQKPKEEQVAKKEQTIPSESTKQTNYYAPPATSSTMIDDFVGRLQKLIEENNQPGFDFQEFVESLFETTQTPGATEYKMVFKIAQKMNKELSPVFLLESSRTYKSLVESAAQKTIADGQKKKEGLKQQMESKRTSLQKEVESIGLQIDQLQRQINDLKETSIAKSNELGAIDGEYTPQFTDFDTKIAAMIAAKERVITSIVDIEAGIQTHIKQ